MCLFVQELEENLRETQSTAQRMEAHLVQKERLYEDKIKVARTLSQPANHGLKDIFLY